MGDLEGLGVDEFDDCHYGYLMDVRRLANQIKKSPKRSHLSDSGIIEQYELVNYFGTIRRFRELAGVDEMDKRMIADWMAEGLDHGTRSYARSGHIKEDTGIGGTAIGMLLSRKDDKRLKTSDGRVVAYERYNDTSPSTTILWRFWFEE